MSVDPLSFGARMEDLQKHSRVSSQHSYEKRIMRELRHLYGYDYQRLLELYQRDDVEDPLLEFKEEFADGFPELRGLWPRWMRKSRLESLILRPATHPVFKAFLSLKLERDDEITTMVFPALQHGDWVLHDGGPGEPLKGVFVMELHGGDSILRLESLKNFKQKRIENE